MITATACRQAAALQTNSAHATTVVVWHPWFLFSCSNNDVSV
jgi:hypothetical protein